MKSKLFFLILLTLSSVSSVFSQNDWEKNPYQNWTKEQVVKILSDSPWVKTKNYQEVLSDSPQLGVVYSPLTAARITLRSALTVRQALLRQRQLDAKYDKMNEANKNKFDEKNMALLNCPACKDYYVVSVLYRFFAMDNKNYVNDRKKYVYLSNDSGDRRELVEFAVLSDRDNEIVFYFPRRDEKGEDLLTSKSKKLIFNFGLKGLDGKSSFPFEKADFDVSKLTVNGEIIF
ncbi:hypothetical protein BH10ACI1_BH10ACI1_24260 [soil metagenome]